MTNKEPENQQQVLFSDSDAVVDHNNAPFKDKSTAFNEQVIFENEEYLPATIDDEAEQALSSEQLAREAESIHNSKPSWLWRIITLLFVTLIAIEAVDFFITGFEQSPIITGLYAIFLGALSVVAGNALWHELMGLKQFKQRQTLKQQAMDILANDESRHSDNSNKRGRVFCEKLNENLPCDLVFDTSSGQQVWQDALSAEHSSAELVQLYSREVLTKVDDKALNEVAKFSTEAVALIALSPVAVIDMLIMLSRNLRMINKIAGLYGLKLGYWSRIKLIKQVFVNMAYAGASELVADLGTEMLGAELMGKLSARLGQGLGAGMLTARLGAQTMELCRPIPFEHKPKLTHVRQKLVQQVKSLVISNKD